MPIIEYTDGHTYVNTFGADGLISRHDSLANTDTYYQHNPRGDIVQRVDGNGNVLSAEAYTAYGSIQQRWGTPNTTDPFGYKGQYGCITDLDTGLVQMGFRSYDPQSGRWLTRDPIGYGGGLNLYQYCGNDPVNFTDVLGLFADDGGAEIPISEGRLWALRGLIPFVQDPQWRPGSKQRREFSNGIQIIPGVSVVVQGWILISGTDPLVGCQVSALERVMSFIYTGIAIGGMRGGGFGGEVPVDGGRYRTLYRAISAEEWADIQATGQLRGIPGGGSSDGKWFAESAKDAAEWGRRFYKKSGPFEVIAVRFRESAASQWDRHPNLDTIGPARYAPHESLSGAREITHFDSISVGR